MVIRLQSTDVRPGGIGGLAVLGLASFADFQGVILQTSEQQFEELLAQLITKVNIVLSRQETVPPLGLLLTEQGMTEVVLVPADTEGPLDTHLDALLSGLRERVAEGGYLATCVGFPDYDKGCLLAFWENRENFCTKVRIPVITEAVTVLDIDQASIEEGIVSIFPGVE